MGLCHQSAKAKTSESFFAQPHSLTYLEPNSLIAQGHPLLVCILSVVLAGSAGEPSSQGKVLWHVVKVGFTCLKGEIYFNPERSKESQRKEQHLQNLKEDSINV